MAVSLDKFVGFLRESGLLPPDEFDALLAEIPAPRKADGEQLARELVKRKKLTAYQAQEVYAGRGKKLVLGNYVIQDKLGQGGMGMVLKAEHRRMERVVALKVMSKAAVESPEAVKRFHREVKAAAKLTHPNIVTAFDADEAGGTHFLVMEFVEGSDLSQLVKKNGPLSVDKAITCILGAARGLEFAHENGVVHRDIKPANLLLDAKGHVKILDMGLARIESVGGEQAELTGTGQIMGTVDYMAPEQAMNTRKADHRADIYSLGISLWYLLTGRVAYGGETVMERLMAHQTHPIPSLAVAGVAATPALEAVFQKMVAKTPGERFQSMSEAIAALERCKTSPGDVSPTVTLPTSEDAKLSDFLKGRAGVPPSGGSSRPAVAVVAAPPAPSTGAGLDVTIVTNTPQADTDPQTQTSLHAPSAAPAVKPLYTDPRVLAIGGGALGVVLLAGLLFWLTSGGPDPDPVPPTKVVAGDPLPDPAVPGGLIFDGVSSHVLLPTLKFPKSGAVTIEAIVTPHQRTGGIVVVSPEHRGGSLFAYANRWVARGLPGGAANYSELTSPIPPEQLGQRVHLAAVWDGSQATLFVDGVRGSTRTDVAVEPNDLKQVMLGGALDAAGKPTWVFDGTIHQVRFSKTKRFTSGPPVQPPARLTLDADTIALYNFDEGTGDVLHDASPNKHDGKIVGAKWVGVDAQPSAAPPMPLPAPPPTAGDFALRFDGPEDLVELPPWPELPLGTTLTIEAWTTLERRLLRRGGRSVFQCGPLHVGAGRGPEGRVRWVAALVGPEKAEPFASQAVAVPGQRVHLALTVNDRGAVLYVNGREEARKGFAGLAVPERILWERLLKQPMTIGGGASPDGNPTNFFGTIDELRISKSRRYDANFTPEPQLTLDADTLALYRFSEGTGTVLGDASSNQRHGKIVGATWVNRGQAPPSALVEAAEPALAPFDEAEAKEHQAAWAKHLGVQVETPNGVGMKMVVIPPGRFMMGRSPGDAGNLHRDKLPDDDLPRHEVTLTKPFAIAATEVTQKQWKDVMNSTPWAGKQQAVDNPDCPATYVSWKDATEFCKRLSEKEKAAYRLPTEAEWEWACRAGTETTFSFGDNVNELHNHAWGRGNSRDLPHPVAQKTPNPWGLFDMHGNTWEWNVDVHGPYSAEAVVDPRGLAAGNKRTLRGGCFWSVPAGDYRSSARRSWPETLGYSESGFRPVRTLEPLATGAVSLEGTWNGVELIAGGVASPREQAEARRIVIASDRYVLTAPGLRIEGVFRHDPAANPQTLEFIPQTGGQAAFTNKPQLGIYTLEGDTLRFCLAPAGGPRPTAMTSAPQGGSIQAYRRASAAGAPTKSFALSFDGIDDLVLLPEIAYDRTSPITFEAWVTPRITEKEVTAQTYRGVWANAGWLLQVSPWGWSHFRNGSDPIVGGIVKGKRVHLAAQWDGIEAALFVDGKRVKGNGKNDGRGSDLPRHLGCVGDLYGNNHKGYFPGIIDEVRISKAARYRADFVPPERHEPDSDTLALYHCDEGEGKDLRDSSGNARHAQIVGAKWVEVSGGKP